MTGVRGHVAGVADREGYLEVRLEGPFERRDLQPALKAVADAVAKCGRKTLLIHNLGVTGRVPTTLERYEISMAVLALPPGLRIAMVSRAEAIDSERFGEKVALNRGLPFGVFPDEASAVEWLLQPGR